METEKIIPTYVHVEKSSGDTCDASEWNALSQSVSETQDVLNSLIEDVENLPQGGGGGGTGSPLDYVVLIGNKAFAGQVTKAGKIYIVQDDFDLQGDSVTLPASVSLRFEGGSVSNGSLILSHTRIEGRPSFSGVTISGSCANDVLTPQMFGATPSDVEDEGNKALHTLGFENLARVLDNEGTRSKAVYIPSGHYAVCRKISFMAGCKVFGDGDATVIDTYDGAGMAFGTKDCCSLIEGCTLTADASKGDNTLSVTDATDIEAGDYLVITDVVDGSFNKGRAYHRASEIVRVYSKEENTVYLHSDLYGTYPMAFGTGDVTTMGNAPGYRIAISHFRPERYMLSDFKMFSHGHSGQTQAYYTLEVNGHIDSLMENVTVENYGNNVAASFLLGMSFRITGCRIRSYVTGIDDAYGLAISHGQDFLVSDCTFRASWHALATGGGNGLYCVVNRNFTYRRLQFERFSNDAHTKDDLDVHANSEYYRYEEIDAPHVSCDTGGNNVTVENCRLYKVGAGFHGAGLTIRNCEIFSTDTANLLYYNDEKTDFNDYSLVIEGTKFHGFVHYDLQGGKKELLSFVFRNNICGGLLLREGKIQKVVFSNNVILRRGFELRNIETREVFITGNIFNDGCIIVKPSAATMCKGAISGNILRYDGSERNVNYVFYISRFQGTVRDNNATNVADNVMVQVANGAVVNMLDNTLKQGPSTTSKAIVSLSSGASVVFNHNVHNSTRSTPLLISDSKGCAKTDKNWSVPDIPVPAESIGETVYIQDQNKMGYTSAGIGSARLKAWSAGKASPIVEQNTLECGKAYFATFRSGYTSLYFSKTGTADGEDMLAVVTEKNMGKAVFNAPDPAEYPYIVIRSAVDGNSVEIYENRSLSEYDGAEMNVSRHGTTASRPEGRKIYVGFTYFDTTLGMPVYAAAIGNDFAVTWVDATGTAV